MAQLVGPGALNVGDTEQRDTTQKEQIGREAHTKDGAWYVYIKAGDALIAKATVRGGGTGVGLSGVLETTNTNEPIVGVVGSTAFANGEYGWVYTRGGTGVSAVAAAGLTVNLVGATTANDGELDAEAAGTLGTRQMVCVTTSSGGVATVRGA